MTASRNAWAISLLSVGSLALAVLGADYARAQVGPPATMQPRAQEGQPVPKQLRAQENNQPEQLRSRTLVDRGRYLVKIAGCNDCHTPGYLMSAGTVPEDKWLTGDSFGWRGPWGTTYAINLRLYMQGLTEDQWLQKASALEARPPMPWWAVREMVSSDKRALYRFIRSLGPGGDPAPAFLPPGKEPKPPFATFPAPPK